MNAKEDSIKDDEIIWSSEKEFVDPARLEQQVYSARR